MSTLAAGIYLARSALRSARSPLIQRYARVLGVPGFFRWVAGDNTPDNEWTSFRTGTDDGAWVLCREDDRGADLVDADETIDVAGGPWRVLPAGTLSAPCTKTLSTVGAVAGDRLLVTRLDVSANAVTLGPLTMPAGQRSWALFAFSRGAWVLRASGLSL